MSKRAFSGHDDIPKPTCSADEARERGLPFSEIHDITPEFARQLLARNRKNRNIRVRELNKYKRAMLAGEWGWSNDAICVNVNGDIDNGQHRLTASADTGSTFRAMITWNLPVESRDNMDRGIRRTTRDRLAWKGYNNPSHLATAARFLAGETAREDEARSRSYVSEEEIDRFVLNNPSVHDSVLVATDNKMDGLSPAHVAAAHWLICQKNSEQRATAFIHQAAHWDALADGHPAALLRKRIHAARRDDIKLHEALVVRLIISAWNLCAAGNFERSRLNLSRDKYIPGEFVDTVKIFQD